MGFKTFWGPRSREIARIISTRTRTVCMYCTYLCKIKFYFSKCVVHTYVL